MFTGDSSEKLRIAPDQVQIDTTHFLQQAPARSVLSRTHLGVNRTVVGTDHYWCGARDQGDVWFLDKPAKNDLHPTMKPVALVERAIRNSSKSRDIVLDPFGGSGTTLIAAERTGRRARLIELDPKYVDVVVQRWQQQTGRTARLEQSGQSFSEMASKKMSAA
jgi:DNA modification methylase